MKRIRGRKGVAIRQQVRTEEPLCRQCFDQSIIRATAEIDHIIPLYAGGTNDRSNMQGLCEECHEAKSAEEYERYAKGFSSRIGADGWPVDEAHPANAGTTRQPFSIPHYLRPSAIPVHIVHGPPGAGKTTFIFERASINDTVIDFDLIRQEIGSSRYASDRRTMALTFWIRNAMLRSLCEKTEGQAWIAMMAPTRAERMAWARALGNVTFHHVHAPTEECKRRIKQDPEREGAREQLYQAVDKYFSVHN